MKKRKSYAEVRAEIKKYWHPTKNSMPPENYTIGFNGKTSFDYVWLYQPYDDPEAGHHDFEWKDRMYTIAWYIRHDITLCPFLTGKAVWTGFNDIKTKCPETEKYFDSKRNIYNIEEICFTDKEVHWHWFSANPMFGNRNELEWTMSAKDLSEKMKDSEFENTLFSDLIEEVYGHSTLSTISEYWGSGEKYE